MPEINFVCQTCGKEYKYKKEKCKCGSTSILEITSVETEVTEQNKEGVVGKVAKIFNPDSKKIADIEKHATRTAKIKQEKANKPLEKGEFVNLAYLPFDILNGFMEMVPESNKYYPLARIWIFEDEELEQLFTYMYRALAKYYPRALDYLGKVGVIVIGLIIKELFKVFSKRVKQSIEWFDLQKKGENDGKESDEGNKKADE